MSLRAPRPRGSLRGLRLLVGFLLLRDRRALSTLVPGAPRCAPGLRNCELVFRTVAAALASERVRARLETLLAAHLGAALLARTPHSPFALAQAFASERERLDRHELFALLLALHTHPSNAAHRIEERVADEIERRHLCHGIDAM